MAALLLLAACGDDDGGADAATDALEDAFVEDASSEDSSAEDVGTGADVTVVDAGDDGGAMDASQDASEPSDAGDDASADAGDDGGRDAGCMYLDSLYYTDCETGFEAFRHFVSDTFPAECPDFYVIDGMRYDSSEEALASLRCEPSCLRTPRNSVTLLRCGRRTGYITFEDETGCTPPLILETPDGVFESADAWDRAAPCDPK